MVCAIFHTHQTSCACAGVCAYDRTHQIEKTGNTDKDTSDCIDTLYTLTHSTPQSIPLQE